jgi:hypothetical protein|tara:strand:- start:3054 stop:3212 length:159 start_codon:yes stop_codon:yes gene_type:complete
MMPSYYDSKEDKPGKAKVKYNKGGKVKKMSKGGRTVARGSGAARPQYFGKNG